MKNFLFVMCWFLGLGLSLFVAFYVLLYGGIMQAINNWSINNSLFVIGIIRAIFFELGFIIIYPFMFVASIIKYN